MKKTTLFIIASIIGLCLCIGCTKDGNPIFLPNSTEVNSICIIMPDTSETIYTDSTWIEEFISTITEAKITNKSSIQDFPQVDSYWTIEISTEANRTTLYYYAENETHYLEQPYQGIYKTEPLFIN